MKFEALTNVPQKARTVLAAGLAVFALGGALESSPADANGTPVGGPPVPGQEYVPPYSQDPETAQCEVEALNSYAGGYLKYIHRNDTQNRYVREVVSANALSAGCKDKVGREFSAEEMMNFGAKFYFNTPQTVVDRSTDAFNKSVVQRTRVPYHCGKYIQQIVHVEVTPTNGDPTMVNNFISDPVTTQCPPYRLDHDSVLPTR